MAIIRDTKTRKLIASPDYNLFFDKETGFTARWGRTKDDDPQYSPFGPEILDLEISSAAENDTSANDPLHIVTNHGCLGLGCQNLCYKAQNKQVYYEVELDDGQILKFSEKEAENLAIGDEIGV